MKRNDSKNNQAFFRTTRVFKKDSSWYFKTREGDTVGPFRDELEVSTQMEIYIRLLDSELLPEAASQKSAGTKSSR
jgi:hypothetical protein